MKLGEFQNSVGQRDAIHVHVVSVKSTQPLYGDQWVQFVDANFTEVIPCAREYAHALVDPFFNVIPKYSVFNVIVKPELVSGFYHQFSLNIEELNPPEDNPYSDGCGDCGA